MSRKHLVICCRVDKRCGFCTHSEPHEVEIHSQYGYNDIRCTEWDECVLYDPGEVRKVRCTKVKKE